MPAAGDGNAIVVERADRALVVRSMDAGTGAVGFAAALPPEPSRTTVVVDASAVGALRALDGRLLDQLMGRLYAEAPPGSEMRLVAARAGRPDPSGAPPLAARLADRLGMGVVAPDGELIALRGGELFSAGPGAGWLGFRRGGHPEWTGPRYPAPAWQAALPREFRTGKPRPFSRLRGRTSSAPVTVTAIPAGLWVRGAGSTPLPLVDLGFGVPVEPSRPVVLVGAPGERTPDVAELAAFFGMLPSAVRENAVLVPYGQEPDACAALAQSLADRLEIEVRAYHALPHYATDGSRRFAVFNEKGAPDRLTTTPENVYAPAAWQTPSPETTVHEPGQMDLTAAAPGPADAPAELGDDEPDEEGYDGGDPVVFDTSIDTPTQPVPALDEGALTPPASEETTAVVTVDAQGFMRPAGRWSTATSPDPRPTLPSTYAAGGSPQNGRAPAPASDDPADAGSPVSHGADLGWPLAPGRPVETVPADASSTVAPGWGLAPGEAADASSAIASGWGLAPDEALDASFASPAAAPGRTGLPDESADAVTADAPSLSSPDAPGRALAPDEAAESVVPALPPSSGTGAPVPFQTTASTVLPRTRPRDVPLERRTVDTGPPPLPIRLVDDPVLSGPEPVSGGAPTPEPGLPTRGTPARAGASRPEPYGPPSGVPQQPAPSAGDGRVSMGEGAVPAAPRTPPAAGDAWMPGREERSLNASPAAVPPPGDGRVSIGEGAVPAARRIPPDEGDAWTRGGEARDLNAPSETVPSPGDGRVPTGEGAVPDVPPPGGDAWTPEGGMGTPQPVGDRWTSGGEARDLNASSPAVPQSGDVGTSEGERGTPRPADDRWTFRGGARNLNVPPVAPPPGDGRASAGEGTAPTRHPRTPPPAGDAWVPGVQARELGAQTAAVLPLGEARVPTGGGVLPAAPPPVGDARTSGAEPSPLPPPGDVWTSGDEQGPLSPLGDVWTSGDEWGTLAPPGDMRTFEDERGLLPPPGDGWTSGVEAGSSPPPGDMWTSGLGAPPEAGPPPGAVRDPAADGGVTPYPVTTAAPTGEFPVPAESPARDYDRRWLADRGSTAEERQAFRASLGWRYDAAARSVARLLAEHPGLRGAATDEALMTELAAVRVFVARDQAELVDTIRSGGGGDQALAVCAAAGLRRLPSFQGVVVRGGPADEGAADAYRPGQDLVEAAPLFALDDVDAGVPGAVEVLIWSATARRLSGFAEDRPVPEVAFLPGTVFRVLAVGPPAAAGEVRRVLLTEVPPAKSGPGLDEWAGRIRDRLEEAAAQRAAAPAEPDDRFAPLPGDPARSGP